MWSYSGDPRESAKDATRFLCGDTDQQDPLLQNEEIEYFLAMYNNTPLNASIRCCEAIMMKFARLVDESVGQVKLAFNQKYKAYQAMVKELKQRLATEDASPYCGGISISDKQIQDANQDRVRPDFTKHMMEDRQFSPWVTSNLEEFLQCGDL